MGKRRESLSTPMPVVMNQAEVEWAKYTALQAENTVLKRENELLGKASSIFATKHL